MTQSRRSTLQTLSSLESSWPRGGCARERDWPRPLLLEQPRDRAWDEVAGRLLKTRRELVKKSSRLSPTEPPSPLALADRPL